MFIVYIRGKRRQLTEQAATGQPSTIYTLLYRAGRAPLLLAHLPGPRLQLSSLSLSTSSICLARVPLSSSLPSSITPPTLPSPPPLTSSSFCSALARPAPTISSRRARAVHVDASNFRTLLSLTVAYLEQLPLAGNRSLSNLILYINVPALIFPIISPYKLLRKAVS